MSQHQPPQPPQPPQANPYAPQPPQPDPYAPLSPPSNPYAPPPPQAPPSYNPYAPPRAEVGAGVGTYDEQTRRELLSHEKSLKTFGFLLMLGGTAATLIGVVMLAGSLFSGDAATGAIIVVVFGLYTGVGVFSFWAGRGIRRLDPKARIPAACLAALGLLGFPLGTLLNAYFLYLLLGEKGRRVLSGDYRAIVERTPHIRYKTSVAVWVLLGFIVLAFIALIVASL